MRLARHSNMVAFVTLAAMLCTVELMVVSSTGFLHYADFFSLVITGDIALGIPLLYYLLLVRTGRSPALALVPVIVAGMLLTQLIVPSTWPTLLARIATLLPIVEGIGLIFVLLKARAVIGHYRRLRPQAVYDGDAFEASMRQVFGASRMMSTLVTELTMPYYLLAGWFLDFKNTHPANIPFTTHRKSGYGLVIGMFSGLIVLESVALHIVIQHWSPLIAWILTGSSIYTLLWVIGHYQSVRLHPIVLSEQGLHVRNGFRWRVDVDWTNIAEVRQVTRGKKAAPGYLNLAVYGEPRFILQFKEPVTAYGLFGSQKQVSQIGLSVDDQALFFSEASKRIHS